MSHAKTFTARPGQSVSELHRELIEWLAANATPNGYTLNVHLTPTPEVERSEGVAEAEHVGHALVDM